MAWDAHVGSEAVVIARRGDLLRPTGRSHNMDQGRASLEHNFDSSGPLHDKKRLETIVFRDESEGGLGIGMKQCSLVVESVLRWAERWFQDHGRLEKGSR